MKKLIFYLVVIALLSSCNTRDGNILHIEEQGSFAVGGTILTDSLGRNYHGDHALRVLSETCQCTQIPSRICTRRRSVLQDLGNHA